MVSHLFFSQLVVIALVWLFIMRYLVRPSRAAIAPQRPAEPIKPRRTRSNTPKAFAGLTHKPHCALCEREAAPPDAPPPAPPAPLPPPHRRPHTVDTARHCCLPAGCEYRGWRGRGTLRTTGHPSGGPWRQWHWTACDGSFPEPHSTLLHGKRVAGERIARVLACVKA